MRVFEFDSTKSASNKAKHGIGFDEAQHIWQDVDCIEVQAKSEDELRYLVIGKIAGRHWSAVITYRGESIRIISVRRSRTPEVAIYESQAI